MMSSMFFPVFLEKLPGGALVITFLDKIIDLILAFVLFSFLAPTSLARRRLRIAVVLEAVIGVCALLWWFVPSARF